MFGTAHAVWRSKYLCVISAAMPAAEARTVTKIAARHPLVTNAGRFRCEVPGQATSDQCESLKVLVLDQAAASPNNWPMKSAWPTGSSFASHFTRPFLIMFTVSIPCSVLHAL